MPFSNLGLPATVVKGVRAAGYTEPTPIQQRAIPIILAGRDLVGAAQTGTGKTAAFLLPILARLLEGHRALRALVLVPTRELAAQVETNARDYGRLTGLRAGGAYGGVPIGRHHAGDLPGAAPSQDRPARPGAALRRRRQRDRVCAHQARRRPARAPAQEPRPLGGGAARRPLAESA